VIATAGWLWKRLNRNETYKGIKVNEVEFDELVNELYIFWFGMGDKPDGYKVFFMRKAGMMLVKKCRRQYEKRFHKYINYVTRKETRHYWNSIEDYEHLMAYIKHLPERFQHFVSIMQRYECNLAEVGRQTQCSRQSAAQKLSNLRRILKEFGYQP
jgi:hypothetical protein